MTPTRRDTDDIDLSCFARLMSECVDYILTTQLQVSPPHPNWVNLFNRTSYSDGNDVFGAGACRIIRRRTPLDA